MCRIYLVWRVDIKPQWKRTELGGKQYSKSHDKVIKKKVIFVMIVYNKDVSNHCGLICIYQREINAKQWLPGWWAIKLKAIALLHKWAKSYQQCILLRWTSCRASGLLLVIMLSTIYSKVPHFYKKVVLQLVSYIRWEGGYATLKLGGKLNGHHAPLPC